ncbi:MAG: T9SS type A sorting domain-containing protein [Cytophagales bacterium]
MKNCKFILVNLLLVFGLLSVTHAQNWHHQRKVEAILGTVNHQTSGDEFGGKINGVDIDGEYAIVGAEFEERDASNSNLLSDAGAAYIIKHNGEGDWDVQAILIPSTREAGARFGHSVAIYGNYAVVGAPFEDVGTTLENDGAVYVFKRSGSTWSQDAKLVASFPDTDDNFGMSVGIWSDVIIAGAPNDDDDANGANDVANAGAVFIYEHNGSSWNLADKVVPSTRSDNDYFGWDVDVNSGYYALAGAPDEDEDASGANTEDESGAAYILEDVNGTWQIVQKLDADDRDSDDHFGYSVATFESYLIIGAPFDEHDQNGANSSTNAGSAYIFEDDAGSWVQVDKVQSTDRDAGDHFGISVGIDGNYVIVGSYLDDEDSVNANSLRESGSADIFKRNSSTGAWDSEERISAFDRDDDDNYGWSVALDGEYAIVGAPNEKNSAGSAYFYGLCVDPTVTDPNNLYCETDPPSGTMTVSANGGNHSIILYVWERVSTSSTVGGNNNSLIPPTLDSYNCTVTNKGCELDDQSANAIATTSAPGSSQCPGEGETKIGIIKNQISIFPNPANSTLKVLGQNLQYVKIYDQMGREILISISRSADLITINTSDLAQGVYILEYSSKSGIERAKVSIQH